VVLCIRCHFRVRFSVPLYLYCFIFFLFVFCYFVRFVFLWVSCFVVLSCFSFCVIYIYTVVMFRVHLYCRIAVLSGDLVLIVSMFGICFRFNLLYCFVIFRFRFRIVSCYLSWYVLCCVLLVLCYISVSCSLSLSLYVCSVRFRVCVS